MRRLIFTAASLLLLLLPSIGNAQLKRITDDLLKSDSSEDTVTMPTQDSAKRADSLLISELQQQVQELKLNEIMLMTELSEADSLKLARQKERIDSLRSHTSGIPLVVGGDTLFTLYARHSGLVLSDRVAHIREVVERLGEERTIQPDSTIAVTGEGATEIMNGDRLIMSVSDQDALWMNMDRDSLATLYRNTIVVKLHELKEKNSIIQLFKRVGLFILIVGIQFFLIRFTSYLYRRAKRWVIRIARTKFKPIIFKNYEFLNIIREARIVIFLLNIIRYIVIALQLIITIPMLFAIFPQTEELAKRLFSYILTPIKSIFGGIVAYIPSLFTIIIIWLFIKYLIRGIRYLAKEIESERLKITGFYPDWAMPSYNIIRFLLYAFMIAMIYPHLPGSDSGVFQGISVFVGLIVSFGSSAVIGNIIAGLVITYMRPFRIGDRIKLNDTTGNVIEKTPFVTRIKTPKNEVITIPNSAIMNNQTVNYSASARDFGLIMHISVSVGYDVPWRKVHQLLIDAALKVDGILKDPKPFVLETSLEDYYPVYQINGYIKDADRYPSIYSSLVSSIQDTFAAENIDIASPMLHEMYNPKEGIVSRQKKYTADM